MKPNPLQERVGTAGISRTEPVVAGSFVDFTITYTAGYFGSDDTGRVKICTRFATDMGRPQFTAPDQPNYVSIVASNGATLEYCYDVKGNVRPWDKTLYIKVVKGFSARVISSWCTLVTAAVGARASACRLSVKRPLS